VIDKSVLSKNGTCYMLASLSIKEENFSFQLLLFLEHVAS
jgi:hypothetical protein